MTIKRDQTVVDISKHVEEYLMKGAVPFPCCCRRAARGAGRLRHVPAVQLIKELEQEIDDYFNDLIVS